MPDPTRQEFYTTGEGRDLWVASYHACNGNRDSMWMWVADLYFATKREVIKLQALKRENEQLEDKLAELDEMLHGD